jgi:Na+-transporting NADH:ubiquinone oxidoreductase subunit NqrF
VEYYLCGPPMMIKAVTKMLAEVGVPTDHVSFDEF